MNGCVIGRYMLCDEIASGGMASVHFGLLLGDESFTRTVAIKRLHPSFAKDAEFAPALLDEGRLQARVHHPNVAAVLDVVRAGDELLLVMEYLHAAPLSLLHRAARAGEHRPSLAVIRAVMVGVLRGLHAAHEARSAGGEPLELVHRDISPQNILVGADGTPRIVDFGIARAAVRSQVTRDGVIKGKPGYMAPEQFTDGPVGRAVDIYAAGVVLWELLTSERLFPGGDIAAVARKALDGHVDPPSAVVPDLPPALDAIVARAVARDPAARFATANELADALEALGPLASPVEVAAWVQQAAGELLARRQAVRERIERDAEHGRAHLRSSAPGAPGEAITAGAATPGALSGPGRGTDAGRGGTGATSPRRSRVPYVIAAAIALLAAAAAGAALAGGALPSGASPVATTEPPEPAAAPPAVPDPSAAPATPLSVAGGPPAASSDQGPPPTTGGAGSDPSPAPSVTPAASPKVAPPPAAQAAPVKQTAGPAPVPRAPSPASPCTTIGSDGIKRWNPRCK